MRMTEAQICNHNKNVIATQAFWSATTRQGLGHFGGMKIKSFAVWRFTFPAASCDAAEARRVVPLQFVTTH